MFSLNLCLLLLILLGWSVHIFASFWEWARFREPDSTIGSTKELSLQRGLLYSRTLDFFHREPQQKELSLVWDTQNGISSDLIFYSLWWSRNTSKVYLGSSQPLHCLLHQTKPLKKIKKGFSINYPHCRKNFLTCNLHNSNPSFLILSLPNRRVRSNESVFVDQAERPVALSPGQQRIFSQTETSTSLAPLSGWDL